MSQSIDPSPPSFDVLKEALQDRATSWSVGTFGAIAEFFHDPETPAIINETKGVLLAQNSLGAIQINASEDLQLIPYEGLSKLEGAWTHGVLVCMRVENAKMANHSGIYELKTNHKKASISDLGMDVAHLDVCIQTDDPALITLLRSQLGSSLFEPKSQLIEAIQAASPVRIFKSKAASIEVYSKIPAISGETPLGPHTHLSLELLRHNQTQAAPLPVPDNWVPVFAFFPPNPIRTITGAIREFDPHAFEYFQGLLAQFGPTPLFQTKRAFLHAMEINAEPDSSPSPKSKTERTALRVALRQYHHSHGPSMLLDKWKAAYEPTWRQ